MPTRRRLLTIAHSYVISLNRRLAHQMSLVGRDSWEVVVAAPTHFHGTRDLRSGTAKAENNEPTVVNFVPAHLTNQVHVFYYGRQLRSILQEGWDLVHCWEEPYVVAGAQIAYWCTQAKIPFVFWSAQNINKRLTPPFSTFEKYCLERCRGWMACGVTTQDTLLQRGYDRRPNTIGPLGVDVDHFRPDEERRRTTREELGWSTEGPPVIGFSGRFCTEKGLALLMSALDQVHGEWRALFIGAGPLEPEVRRWSEKVPRPGLHSHGCEAR